MDELLHKKVETLIKVIGLSGLFFGAYQGYLSFNQKAELQALRALHEAQMRTCEKLVMASSDLLAQTNSKDLYASYLEYSKIKHGLALTFLDQHVIDKSVEVYNALIPALSHADENTLRSAVRCALGNTPFELAIACRKSISNSYKRESGNELSPLSEEYTMGWAGECNQT